MQDCKFNYRYIQMQSKRERPEQRQDLSPPNKNSLDKLKLRNQQSHGSPQAQSHVRSTSVNEAENLISINIKRVTSRVETKQKDLSSDRKAAISNASLGSIKVTIPPELLQEEKKRPSSSRAMVSRKRRLSVMKYAKVPIATELHGIWEFFFDQHWQSKRVNQIIVDVMNVPQFVNLTFLVLEDKQIEQIFQFIQPCQQLQAVFLKNNRLITRDLPYISALTNLRKVDLSNNDIHFLPETYQLERLEKLEFLMLHQNQLVGWRQIELLTCLKHLRYITLQGNPCAKVIGYRKFLIECMPELRCLDEFIIGDFERSEMSTLFPASTFRGDKLRQLRRFRPHNKETQTFQSLRFEATPNHPDFYYSHSKAEITKHIEWEHYRLRRKYEWCSPVLTIQKTIRMVLARKRYKRIVLQMRILYWALRRYNTRYKTLEFIQKLGLTPQMLHMIGKVRLIQKRYREYRRRKAIKNQTAERMQSIFRMQRVQNVSFIDALDLRLDGQSTDKRFIFTFKQMSLCQQIGLTQFFESREVMADVALKKNVTFDVDEHRQSPLLSLIKASYKMVKLNEPHKLHTDKSGLQMLADHLVPPGLTILQARLKPRKTKKRRNNTALSHAEGITNSNALVAVSFSSDAALAEVFRRIMMYNRKHDNILLVFYEPFMMQFRAKMMIQRWVRGTLLRQQLREIFQPGRLSLKYGIDASKLSLSNTIYAHYAVALRAVRKIMSCWRAWKIRMRISALHRIAVYAKEINSNVVFMDQNVYVNLNRMQLLQNKATFPEQHFNFELLEKDYRAKVNFPLGKDKTSRYMSQNFPLWFISLLEARFPLINPQTTKHIPGQKQEPKTGSQIEKSCFSLLHTVSLDDMPAVISLSDFFDVGETFDYKFIKVTFENVAEARARAVLIALLTCRYLRGSNCFGKLYTLEQLVSIQRLEYETLMLLNAYKIVERQPIGEFKSAIELGKTNGIIQKRMEPYRGIIKSRPRQTKKDYDRFIVLSDADPKVVEQRIAEVMKHQQTLPSRQHRRTVVERGKSFSLQRSSAQNNDASVLNAIYNQAQQNLARQSMRNMPKQQLDMLKDQTGRYMDARNHSLLQKFKHINEKMSLLNDKIKKANNDELFKTLYVSQMMGKSQQATQSQQSDQNKALVVNLPSAGINQDQMVGANNEVLEQKIQEMTNNYRAMKKVYKRASAIYQGQMQAAQSKDQVTESSIDSGKANNNIQPVDELVEGLFPGQKQLYSRRIKTNNIQSFEQGVQKRRSTTIDLDKQPKALDSIESADSGSDIPLMTLDQVQPNQSTENDLQKEKTTKSGKKKKTNIGKLIKRISMAKGRQRADTDQDNYDFPMLSDIAQKQETFVQTFNNESLPIHLNVAESISNMKTVANKYNAFWQQSEQAFEDIRSQILNKQSTSMKNLPSGHPQNVNRKLSIKQIMQGSKPAMDKEIDIINKVYTERAPGLRIILPANPASQIDQKKHGLLSERVQQLSSNLASRNQPASKTTTPLKKLLQLEKHSQKQELLAQDEAKKFDQTETITISTPQPESTSTPRLFPGFVEKTPKRKQIVVMRKTSCSQRQSNLPSKPHSKAHSPRNYWQDLTQIRRSRPESPNFTAARYSKLSTQYKQEIQMITKSLLPIASQPLLAIKNQTYVSSKDRKRFLLQSIHDRIKQDAVQNQSKTMNLKVFAPVDHSQIIQSVIQNQRSGTGIGFIHQRQTSNNKSLSSTGFRGPKVSSHGNTLEHVLHKRMLQQKADQQIINLEQYESIMKEEKRAMMNVEKRGMLTSLKLTKQQTSLLLPTLRPDPKSIRDDIAKFKVGMTSIPLFNGSDREHRRPSMTISRKLRVNEFKMMYNK